MFTFLKLIKPLLLPSGLIVLALAAVLYLLIRKKLKSGIVIVAAVLGFFYLLSTEPANYFLVRSLERTIAAMVTPADLERGRILNDPASDYFDPVRYSDVDAIVILAGGAASAGPFRPFPELKFGSWNRFWHGLEIYWKLEGSVRIVYSGGSGDLFQPKPIEASLARSYAQTIGIPEEDFLIENTSRNTFENGRETRKLLEALYPGKDSFRIILVTSSIHTPRAILVMKEQGINVIPAPADFLVHSLNITVSSFLPSADMFKYSTDCLHEWLGILGYKFLNRI